MSSDITLYDQHGSEVLLGNTLMVPVGNSIIYLRPLYVASSSNPLPQLTDVIGVLGQKVVIDSSLGGTLSNLLNTPIATPGGSPGGGGSTGPGIGTVPTQVQQELAAAQTYYQQAMAALKAGNLGAYQSDIAAMDAANPIGAERVESGVRHDLDDHHHDNADDHDHEGQEYEARLEDQDADHDRAQGFDHHHHDAGYGGGSAGATMSACSLSLEC